MQSEELTAMSASDMPSDALFVTFSSGEEPSLSKALRKYFEGNRSALTAVTEGWNSFPEGCWPVLINNETFLMSVLRMSPGKGLLYLRCADREELTRYVDDTFHGDRMIISDSAGILIAASSTFDTACGADRISEVLDPPSLMALSGALEGISDSAGFNVSQTAPERTYVLDTRRLPLPGNLVLMRFSNPSVSMTGNGRADGLLANAIFEDFPIPVVGVDEQGRITWGNESARDFANETLGCELDCACFDDLIVNDDGNGITASNETGTCDVFSPIRYNVALISAGGSSVPCKVAALQVSGTPEVIVFLFPECSSPALHEDSDHVIRPLLALLDNIPDEEDLLRWILEFIREGTLARGVSCRLVGRTVTVGDVQLEDDESGVFSSVEVWETNDEELYDLTIPAKHRYGLFNLRLSGLPEDSLPPLQRFVLKMAVLFIDYWAEISSMRMIMKTFSSLVDFCEILSDGKSSLEGMLESIADISHSDSILISVLNGGEAVLKPLSGFGFTGELPLLQLQQDSVASWAYTHNELTYMADSGRDSRFEPVFPLAGSELAVPLLSEGRPAGTLVASCRRKGGYLKPVPSQITILGAVLSLWLFGSGQTPARGKGLDTSGDSTGRAQLYSLLQSLSARLKSPLAALTANVELILDERTGQLNSDQAECADSMKRSIADLTRQSDRLLTFMKLELQEEEFESVWGKPVELVSAVLQPLLEEGRQNEVTVTVEYPDESFIACFDINGMEQIVANLVDNAIRFNRPGGEVLVKIDVDSDVWTLQVSDSGSGIDSSELPYLFDRFHRHEFTGVAGLGIGLAIVKHFTELHKGVINVWSNRGSGTKFVLRFPTSG